MMGLSGVIFSLVGMRLFTNFVHGLLQRFDWRTTYALLGALELLVMAPLGLLLFRDRPEHHGLQPDGPLGARETRGRQRQSTGDWTRDEAVRNPAFWTVAASVAATPVLGTGLYFHMVSIFESQGLSSDIAAAVYLPLSVTSAVVQLSSGYLADRVPVRILLAVGLAAMSGTLGLAQALHGVRLVGVYSVVLGLSNGIIGTVSSVVWAIYYGRQHLNSISGLAATVSRVSSALGPLPLAVAFDLWGGYGTALRVGAVILLVLVALNLVVKPPRKAPALA
jgi:hypothetical protein